jgi:hypothetical protein
MQNQRKSTEEEYFLVELGGRIAMKKMHLQTTGFDTNSGRR